MDTPADVPQSVEDVRDPIEAGVTAAHQRGDSASFAPVPVVSQSLEEREGPAVVFERHVECQSRRR